MSPQYQFACDPCKKIIEVKMTMAEHTDNKNKIYCDCSRKMYQVVSPLNFRLAGEGWFGKASDAIEHPYAITQRELNKNLDVEKRIEDVANNYSDKESN